MRGTTAAALLFGVLLAAGAAAPPRAPRSMPLDIEVEQDPVAEGRTLRLFGREARNQRMDLDHDKAPDCSPVPIEAALQPVACAGAVFALDRGGALWRLAGGFPKTVDQLEPGALALLPGEPQPATLYADRLRLPSGARAPLPFAALGGCAAAGGWWVRGEKGAAWLNPDGTLAWTWIPAGLHPADACASGRLLLAGSAEGWLVALDATSGKERWRYRTGGAVARPIPAPGGGVILASADHSLRRLDGRGRLLWQCRLSARLPWPPIAYGAGWLAAEQAGRRVALVDGASGKVIWHWDAQAGELLRPPVVAGSEACVLVSTGETKPALWILPLPPLPAEKARG